MGSHCTSVCSQRGHGLAGWHSGRVRGPGLRRSLVALLLLTGCAAARPSVDVPAEPGPDTTIVQTVTTTRVLQAAASTSTTSAPGSVVEISYRIERRVGDEATAGFEAAVHRILTDSQGWGRAGFRFVPRRSAPFAIILAEGPEVDALCLPYDTYGKYSCQNGPVVALNADRWRKATPKWTGDLASYRAYLVGHEVGHLLGLHHPSTQCPGRGRPAPLMSQQSTELNGCRPNSWPLPNEVDVAAVRPAVLAPPPEQPTP